MTTETVDAKRSVIVTVTCDRCKEQVQGTQSPGITGGYYEIAGGWQKYANHGENRICDACMWSDPRYIADYGPAHTEK